jgi:hypothetical protein
MRGHAGRRKRETGTRPAGARSFWLCFSNLGWQKREAGFQMSLNFLHRFGRSMPVPTYPQLQVSGAIGVKRRCNILVANREGMGQAGANENLGWVFK